MIKLLPKKVQELSLFKKKLTNNPYSSISFSKWNTSLGLADSKNYQDYYDAYRSVVYWCVNIRAKAVAKAEYSLYVKRRKDEIEVPNDHPYFRLVDRPNRYKQTYYDMKYLIQVYKDLVGNAYEYIATRDALGKPAEIIILPPQFIKIAPNPDGTIKEYQFHYPNGSGYTPLRPEDIIHHKYPNPADFYYGMSPLKAASYASDADLAMSIYTKTFMENDATPKFALLTKNRLTDSVFNDFVDRWHDTYSGNNKAGLPAVLDNGLDIKPISLSPKEADYLMSKKGCRDEIMQVFEIPPVIGNVTENVNRGSSTDGMLNFIDNTIDPILKQEAELLQLFLKDEYDDRLCVRYWIDRPSNLEVTLKEVETGIKCGYLSINEAREIYGYDPVPDGDEVKPFNPNPVEDIPEPKKINE